MKPKCEQADGKSSRAGGRHQFTKRRKRRTERHAANRKPDVQPGYGKYQGYET